MGTIYVARSSTLSKWGADVGLGKNLFKLGYAEGTAEEALKALKEEAHCGAADWLLAAKQTVVEFDLAAAIASLQRKEKMVDPALYPKLRGTLGIFKVKLTNVENSLMVQKALEGMQVKEIKLKPADIGGYLIANALK